MRKKLDVICVLVVTVLAATKIVSIRTTSERIYNVVVLGNTGVGKSSLLNMLAGCEYAFRVGDGAMSETSLATAQVHRFLGRADGVQLRLIDTQGLSDSSGDQKDMENLKNMVEAIRQQGHIDLFIVCFEGPAPRFSHYAQSMVSLFSQIFGDFLQHSVLVFNKWTRWTSSEFARLEALRADYQHLFSHDYHLSSRIPCFFVDSNFNRLMLRDNDDGTVSMRYLHESMQEHTRKQLDALIAHLTSKGTTCDVQSIEAQNTEKERLRLEAERSRQELIRQSELQQERMRHELEQQRLANERLLARIQAEAAAERARLQAEELARQQALLNILVKPVEPIQAIGREFEKIGKDIEKTGKDIEKGFQDAFKNIGNFFG